MTSKFIMSYSLVNGFIIDNFDEPWEAPIEEHIKEYNRIAREMKSRGGLSTRPLNEDEAMEWLNGLNMVISNGSGPATEDITWEEWLSLIELYADDPQYKGLSLQIQEV